MRKRHFIFPLVPALMIFAMFVIFSCAHQEPNGDEEGMDAQTEQTEESVADGGSEGSEGQPSEASENKSPEALSELEATIDDDKAKAENAGGDAAQNADATAQADQHPADGSTPPGDVPPGDVPPQDAAASNDLPPVDSGADKAMAKNDAPPAGGEATPPAETPPADAGAPAEPPPIPPVEAKSDTLPEPQAPAPAPSPVSAPAPKAERPRYAGAKVPHIPGRALKRRGALLNRFYFVRQGDSPRKVSELIYGTPDHARDLIKWNPGKKWKKPGTLVFYNSPSESSDRTMRSFYQERSIQPEEYTVHRGDWLSRIAAQRLGSPGSWKEIAVVNGLESADSLNKGQKLAIYPADLSSAGQPAEPPPQQQAQISEPPPQQKAQPPVVEQAPPPPPPKPVTPPPPPPEPSANELAKTIGPKNATPNVGKLLEQNMLAVVIGGILLLLVFALMALNKKKGRRDEFGEDGFSAPPRVKRK